MGSKQVQRDMGEPFLLTYREAAAKMGVSLARVYRLLRDGELHNVPLGPRERRIPLSECEAYVDRLKAQHLGEAS